MDCNGKIQEAEQDNIQKKALYLQKNKRRKIKCQPVSINVFRKKAGFAQKNSKVENISIFVSRVENPTPEKLNPQKAGDTRAVVQRDGHKPRQNAIRLRRMNDNVLNIVIH